MLFNNDMFNQDISKWIINKNCNFDSMFSGAASMIYTYENDPDFGNSNNDYTPNANFFTSLMPVNNSNINSLVDKWITNPYNVIFNDPNNSEYYGPIEIWDTSQVTDMGELFYTSLEDYEFSDYLYVNETLSVNTTVNITNYKSNTCL